MVQAMELETITDLTIFEAIRKLLTNIKKLILTIYVTSNDRYSKWKEFLGVKYSTSIISDKHINLLIATNKLDLDLISRSVAMFIILDVLLMKGTKRFIRKVLELLTTVLGVAVGLSFLLSFLGVSKESFIPLLLASVIYAVVEIPLKVLRESSRWRLIKEEGGKLIKQIEELGEFERLKEFIQNAMLICLEGRGEGIVGTIGVFRCKKFNMKKVSGATECLMKIERIS